MVGRRVSSSESVGASCLIGQLRTGRPGIFSIIWDTVTRELALVGTSKHIGRVAMFGGRGIGVSRKTNTGAMGKLREWMPEALTAGALAGTGLTLAHSLWARGRRRTVVFAALGMGLPLASEFAATNMVRVVRHRTRPQVCGVPLAAVAWYNIGYAAHAVVEDLLIRAGMSTRARRWLAPTGTAALATSLDLLFDCFGLDMGLWEWRDGGPYAREIVGPNGKAGIPLTNFAGWVALTGGVSLGYELLAEASGKRRRGSKLPAHVSVGTEVPAICQRDDLAKNGSERKIQITVGRTAALLLAPYYLAAAAWAIAQRKPKYLAYSALVPAALAASMTRWPQKGRSPFSSAGGAASGKGERQRKMI